MYTLSHAQKRRALGSSGLAQSPPQSARAFKVSGNETSRASLLLAKRNVASGNEIGAGQTILILVNYSPRLHNKSLNKICRKTIPLGLVALNLGLFS